MNDRSSKSRMRAIGITQRSTPLDCAWTGDLRVRFTDFQVNEISENGEVVHLKSIGTNDGQQEATDAIESEKPKTEGQVASKDVAAEASNVTQDAPPKEETPKPKVEEVSPEDVAILTNLAGEKFAQDIVHIYQNAEDPEVQKQKSTAEPTDDRSKRTQIHQEVRRIFNSKLETSTNDAGVIVASLITRKGNKRGRGGRNNRNNNGRREEKPAGEYLHFTMYKDNRDTMDAVNQIARMLRVKPQSIGYAGTKDRRASTSQRCSVRYVRERALAGINGKLRGVVTGDYEYTQNYIRLGQLAGNEFVITIKDCKLVDSTEKTADEHLWILNPSVQSALNHMSKHGWINYFGHQRFGTHGVGTHEVGKLILEEKYEEAVNALLSYDSDLAEKAERDELPEEASQRDEYNRALACMLFMTNKNFEKANQIIPRRFTAEVCLLRHLTRSVSNSRKDFVGAIVHITRGLRTMYLHAYQSHVWNHVASYRWGLHRDNVVAGDLVLAEAETKKGPEVDQDGGDVINPNDDLEESEFTQQARALTEEEAASGRFTIHDVVLPTPGYEVVYPHNEIGAYYTKFMRQEENGSLDPHNMRRIRREFSLPGRYRPLMNRFLSTPSVEFRTYVDDTEQMHPTDLDLIRAAQSKNKRKGGNEPSEEPATKRVKGDETQTEEGPEDLGMDTTKEVGSMETGENEDVILPFVEKEKPKKVAAVVKFQLGSSAYATVTLRELMGDPPEE